jgi:hypothetical protein
MPVSTLLVPSGAYNVGKLVTHIVKEQKKPSEHDLRVVCFYPTSEKTDGYLTNARHPNRYMPKVLAARTADYPGLPPILFKHMALAKPPVRLDAAPLCAQGSHDGGDAKDSSGGNGGGLPVVVFSHGLGAVPEMYTSILMDLASHGFVVMALSHSDGSAAAVLDARNEVILKHHMLTKEEKEDEFGFRRKQLEHRVAELLYFLDFLQHRNKSDDVGPSSLLFQSILRVCDTNNISLKGHSFGACTVYQTMHNLQAAQQSNRIATAILHDLWTFPLLEETKRGGTPDEVPIFFLHSAEWMGYGTTTQDMMRCASHVESRFYSMKECRHSNFADVPLFSAPVAKKMGAIATKLDPIACMAEIALFSRTWMLHHQREGLSIDDHEGCRESPSIQKVHL